MLPMVPAVYAALRAKWEATGKPEEGWLFPSSSREGHFNKDTAKAAQARHLSREREGEEARRKRTQELSALRSQAYRAYSASRSGL